MAELQPPEKEANWFRKVLYCVLILTVLGAFSGLAVSSVNRITAPVVAANEEAQLLELLESMMPEADEYKLVTKNGTDIYFGVKNREVLAAVIPGEEKGFSGESVDILTIVNSEEQIEDVVLLGHKETPWWGEQIEEPLFLAQFEGATRESVIAEADIISGATVSSQAVINAVVKTVELYTVASID